jgi:hypothetical protein
MFDIIRKNRDKWFPLFVGKWHTEDFKKNIVPKLKKSNPNSLSYQMWFYFHPSAYKLLYYGSPIIILICVSPAFIWALLNKKLFTLLILGVLLYSMGKSLYQKIKYKCPKNYTFYDELLKTAEDEAGIEVK